MTDLEKIVAEATTHPGVYSATIWDNRRVYVNFVGFDRSFAGCRNLKVFYDAKLGWRFDGAKGNYPGEFISNARSFAEKVGLFSARGGSPF